VVVPQDGGSFGRAVGDDRGAAAGAVVLLPPLLPLMLMMMMIVVVVVVVVVVGADGGTAAIAASSNFQQQAKVGLATYATGIVYGLHPDALFVVIPALALPTKLAAIAYCSMFVIGTVAAMGGYTLVIGTTSAALTKERPWLQAHLSTIASGVAIVVGALILLSGFGLNVPFFG